MPVGGERPPAGRPVTLQFGLIGPLEARREGVPVALGGPRQRSVLAVLLLSARRVVPVPALLDAVWDGAPGDKAEGTLQVHVSGLRRALGPDGAVVVTRPPGYLLELPSGAVDLDRFRAAREAGAAAHRRGQHAAAAGLFREALALWRGRALADLAGLRFADEAAVALEEERLAVLEQRLAADLAAGAADELVGELRQLVGEHPLREGLWHSLVLALYRSSRQADALTALADVRALLRDELGIAPGAALQDLQRRVLAQDPALEAPPQRPPELALTRPAASGPEPLGVLEAPGRRYELGAGRVRIGRDPSGDVVLDGDEVSRRHCEVVAAAGELLVVDRGSTNGTWVNGERVVQHVLQDGDRLRVGEVVLVYRRLTT